MSRKVARAAAATSTFNSLASLPPPSLSLSQSSLLQQPLMVPQSLSTVKKRRMANNKSSLESLPSDALHPNIITTTATNDAGTALVTPGTVLSSSSSGSSSGRKSKKSKLSSLLLSSVVKRISYPPPTTSKTMTMTRMIKSSRGSKHEQMDYHHDNHDYYHDNHHDYHHDDSDDMAITRKEARGGNRSIDIAPLARSMAEEATATTVNERNGFQSLSPLPYRVQQHHKQHKQQQQQHKQQQQQEQQLQNDDDYENTTNSKQWNSPTNYNVDEYMNGNDDEHHHHHHLPLLLLHTNPNDNNNNDDNDNDDDDPSSSVVSDSFDSNVDDNGDSNGHCNTINNNNTSSSSSSSPALNTNQQLEVEYGQLAFRKEELERRMKSKKEDARQWHYLIGNGGGARGPMNVGVVGGGGMNMGMNMGVGMNMGNVGNGVTTTKPGCTAATGIIPNAPLLLLGPSSSSAGTTAQDDDDAAAAAAMTTANGRKNNGIGQMIARHSAAPQFYQTHDENKNNNNNNNTNNNTAINNINNNNNNNTKLANNDNDNTISEEDVKFGERAYQRTMVERRMANNWEEQPLAISSYRKKLEDGLNLVDLLTSRGVLDNNYDNNNNNNNNKHHRHGHDEDNEDDDDDDDDDDDGVSHDNHDNYKSQSRYFHNYPHERAIHSHHTTKTRRRQPLVPKQKKKKKRKRRRVETITRVIHEESSEEEGISLDDLYCSSSMTEADGRGNYDHGYQEPRRDRSRFSEPKRQYHRNGRMSNDNNDRRYEAWKPAHLKRKRMDSSPDRTARVLSRRQYRSDDEESRLSEVVVPLKRRKPNRRSSLDGPTLIHSIRRDRSTGNHKSSKNSSTSRDSRNIYSRDDYSNSRSDKDEGHSQRSSNVQRQKSVSKKALADRNSMQECHPPNNKSNVNRTLQKQTDRNRNQNQNQGRGRARSFVKHSSILESLG